MTKMEDSSVILVVDPSEARVRKIVTILNVAGWITIGTSDPWEAMTLLSQLTVNLVVLDPELTGMGASDFCCLLQDDPGLREIPTIFVSDEAPRHAAPFEPSAWVRNIHDPAELIDRVHRLLVSPFPPEEVPGIPGDASPDTRFFRRSRAVPA